MEKTAAPVPPNLEAFIKRWSDREGGAERANYALFLVELCDLIGVQRPDPAGQETERNEYVFERAVRFHHVCKQRSNNPRKVLPIRWRRG